MVFPTFVSSIVSYTATVVMTVQARSSVQVTGYIPYQMDSRQSGFFGAVFWNPTEDSYEITRVEFDASTAVNQVFSRLEQGNGNSYPLSGWVLDSTGKVVYLPATLVVPPHTAAEFYVRIAGNRRTELFSVQVRVRASGMDCQEVYSTSQRAAGSPFSALWLGQGPTPRYMTTAFANTEQTFYVTLQEDSGTTSIRRGGTMTITLPQEFTNIISVGGSGWGTANIAGSTIEVTNTQAIIGNYRTYAFRATTPISEGAYTLDVSFDGTPDEHPRGNFVILINGCPPAQILLYCDSYAPAQASGWRKVGTSPYLNAVDYPSNYIHTSTRLSRDGNFGFQNSGGDSINTVSIDINGMTARQSDSIRIRIYDGSTWTDLGSVSLPTSFEWISIDVTSHLDSWDKINAAQLWFQFRTTNNAGHVYIDCVRLRING